MVKKNSMAYIFSIVLAVLLSATSLYMYSNYEKVDYAIKIGTPTGSSSLEEKILFNEPLYDKKEANLLIFSLINAKSIDKPKISEKLPNAVISFDDWKEGVNYFKAKLWIDGDNIVVETNDSLVNSDYKLISGSEATDIKKIVEKYHIKGE